MIFCIKIVGGVWSPVVAYLLPSSVNHNTFHYHLCPVTRIE